MTSWEREEAEAEAQADAIALFFRELERLTPYENYCESKKCLRRVLEPEVYALIRRLLHRRGVEL